jgi:hypothetical protein
MEELYQGSWAESVLIMESKILWWGEKRWVNELSNNYTFSET